MAKGKALRISTALLRRWLPHRGLGAHKGDFGHVLIVAGSRGMTGAAVLSARAALRSGAGLTTVAAPRSQQPIIASQLLEAQTLSLPETSMGTIAPAAAGELRRMHRERGYRVLALGPGLTTHAGTARAVAVILRSIPLPAVIDADGLNCLARLPRRTARALVGGRGAPCVLTPHPGEMARLLGVSASAIEAGRVPAARRLAREFDAVVVLKGRHSVVTDGTSVALNPTGNPGLAKGGSGDVLTGIIAAFWSQQLGCPGAATFRSGFEAAVLGTYLHGLSADLAVAEKTVYSLLASDVIESLPSAFRKLG